MSITPDITIKMQLDILDDWVLKDTLTEYLCIDTSSIHQNMFYIHDDLDSFPAYRYINENGYELYIEKERCYDSYDQNGKKNKKHCTYDLVSILLPKARKLYVERLPLMYHK